MVVKSLKSNYLWRYSININDAVTRSQIEDALENIADSCEWYDDRKTDIQDYPTVLRPTHWRTGWIGGKIQRNPSIDQFLNELESDGELEEMYGLVDDFVEIDLSDSGEEEDLDQATTTVLGTSKGTTKGNRDNYIEQSQRNS
jgi:hypothetical protein